MSKGMEELEFSRDWFSSAALSDTERLQILGTNPERQAFQQATFNWVSSYLYHEVGLHEEELVEWFRWSMKDRGDKTHLDVWQEEDGFDQVYRAAEAWREQVAEDLGDEPNANEGITINPTQNERENMQQALNIFLSAFEYCGVELNAEDGGPADAGLWNGNNENPFFIHFQRGNGGLEGYKIGMCDGPSAKRLCLLTWQPPGEARQIVQATIGESFDSSPEDDYYQSDIDPFPKRADAEPFIRRLQECIVTGTLVKAEVGAEV